MDVEGDVDVDVGILADVERLGEVYRHVDTGDVAFTEVPPEFIAAFTEVPPEFAEPEFAQPEFADSISFVSENLFLDAIVGGANAVPSEPMAPELTVSSSLIFLVLRLSSSDALERERDCNDVASGPLLASGSLRALINDTSGDPSGVQVFTFRTSWFSPGSVETRSLI